MQHHNILVNITCRFEVIISDISMSISFRDKSEKINKNEMEFEENNLS